MRLDEVVLVPSSKAGAPPYKVRIAEQGNPQAPELVMTCTCKGYEFRRQCRHVNETVQQRLRQEPCPSCGETAWSEVDTVAGGKALLCDACAFDVVY